MQLRICVAFNVKMVKESILGKNSGKIGVFGMEYGIMPTGEEVKMFKVMFNLACHLSCTRL